MKESMFRKYLRERGSSAEQVDFAITAFKEFEKYLADRKTSFESAELDKLVDYISLLIAEGKNSLDRMLAMARYCSFTRKNDYYIYFTSILGAIEVLPNLSERLATIAGEETRGKIFKDFKLPPLGAPQEQYPHVTMQVMDRLEAELTPEMCRDVLTGNYHEIPVEAFKGKKEQFEKASSIDEYLKEEHRMFVEELTRFMNEGRIWYEQQITPDVLAFVKNNQEIHTGVRQNDKIFITKMPYAPEQYLKETDPIMKRYYSCHCQLARTAIRDGSPKISPAFCYCSGGFNKLPFDVIFDEPVEVEVLESALKGDMRCRFMIKIPKGKVK